MKLEQQVTSLEISRKLEKLGVKQDSLFVWWYTEAMSTDVKYFPDVDWDKRENKLRLREPYMKDSGRDIAAFTVAELGEMLPDNENLVTMFFLNGRCQIYLNHEVPNQMMIDLTKGIHVEANTEADARGKMLIYLIENNLIKL